ncbi:MAG TPA: MBL fold metallo-hydrolase [Acidimicrobiales bacterium]|nr:MBL fold metallo-hydrolase [Acidimicrobiales bacterium]
MDAAPAPRPRRQEQERASAEITEVAPNILRSQLPVFLPGLGHVNCYLLQDDRGVALVDPGLPGPQSWRALVDRLRQAGYRPKDVHTVVVTHSHPDHFGGAGRFREKYGADVLTHRSFKTWFDPVTEEAGEPGEDGEPVRSEPPPMPFGRALPWRQDQTLRPPIGRRLKFQVMRKVAKRFMRAPSPTRRVADAEVVTLAGREWVSLHTPGHTADHLCLYDPVEGVVLSGDHVLPTITPHISGLVAVSGESGGDPLTEFFLSLEKVADLPGVRQVLPAHGHPFDDLASRAKEIRQHHEERLETLRLAAGELGEATVEQLMQRLFKQRSWGQMAESETYAHLEHLRVTGEAESRFDDGLLRYHLVD